MELAEKIDPTLDLAGEIVRLKKERNAVILAHYYQEDDIQDIADFIGDSLQLAQAAKSTAADVIVFCGVHFMAETAKILNPSRTVVIPDMDAGCSLADGCPAPEFARFRAQHPDHFVVSYINCSAAVKALSDVICTSSNAVKIVSRIPKDRPVIFAPDKHLGAWVRKQTGRDDMVLWNGTCIVHETFSERKLIDLKVRHPQAKVIAHPECTAPVLNLADHIGSTKALLEYTRQSEASEFIVATEPGIIHQMEKYSPRKKFIPAPGEDESCNCNECPYMKLNTMEKIYAAMRDLKPTIEMDEAVRLKALKPLELMLEWSA
ncbi:MAG: quinolinate synthase NadA [Deltaproteobacteria bacterium]|nr:quinolinate synthase NadA [Deltaproteobacteria bacterium]